MKVKALVLGAGYGTRLARGVRADESGKYEHLLGLPKPLVPVGGTPLLTRWVQQLEAAGLSREDVFVVSNAHFAGHFRRWAEDLGFPVENIVDDGTTSNDTRLGAIRDLQLVVQAKGLDDGEHSLLVVGGDTLFFDDFDLRAVLAEHEALRGEASHVLWYHDEATTKTGILELHEGLDSEGVAGRVCAFLEKPQPTETASRSACPCFYVLAPRVLQHDLHEYVAAQTSLKGVDAPGNLIAHLQATTRVYALQISGRFDIGDLATYVLADDHFEAKRARSHAVKTLCVGGAVIGAIMCVVKLWRRG